VGTTLDDVDPVDLHLHCPSGIAGNLVVSALAATGLLPEPPETLIRRLGVDLWLAWRPAGETWRGPVGDTVYRDVTGYHSPTGTVTSVANRCAAAFGPEVGGHAGTLVRSLFYDPDHRILAGNDYADTLFDVSAAAYALATRPIHLVVHGPLPHTPRSHPRALSQLEGWLWQWDNAEAELVTPTGAALLAAYGQQTLEPFPTGVPTVQLYGSFAAHWQLPPLRAAALRHL
jgi:hypothetical protein